MFFVCDAGGVRCVFRWHPRDVIGSQALPLWGAALGLGCLRRWVVCLCFARHPRDVIGSQALPLCGAAPTFLCGGKEK
ncbi:hypothetical protein PCAR4_490001 [Paraburkholderia caribensis]|nr:hypothetical protein PCAR4_490001 [Paraburkholderia caribensis]